MNKECRPAETVRRRNPRKPAVSKTTRLEEKLDDLVSLIKAGAHPSTVNASPYSNASPDNSTYYVATEKIASTLTRNEPERGIFSNSSNNYIHNIQALTPVSDDYTGSSYHILPSGSSDTSGEPSPVEAEQNLLHFQTYKSKYFPFMSLPSTTTAKQLRQDRPFLWLCIMAVGSKSTSQQQALGSRIRQTIAQELVVQSERSIDHLLGLLTFIGWYGISQPRNREDTNHS